MMLNTTVLSNILLGSFFTSVVYLGIGLQKKGIHHYRHLKDQGIGAWLLHQTTWEWAIGCVAAAVGNILFFSLVTGSTFNLLMPLNGVGLIFLTLYAVYVLDETISHREYVAIISIALGIGMSTFFSIESSQTIDETAFYYLTAVIFILIIFITIYRALKKKSYPAVLESINAGLLAAYSAFMIKNTVFVTQNDILLYGIVAGFFLFQFLSWLFMQLAYNSGRATTAVPIYTALLILFPIVGGVVIYNEVITLFQIIGILFVASGGTILARYAAIEVETVR